MRTFKIAHLTIAALLWTSCVHGTHLTADKNCSRTLSALNRPWKRLSAPPSNADVFLSGEDHSPESKGLKLWYSSPPDYLALCIFENDAFWRTLVFKQDSGNWRAVPEENVDTIQSE
jgi:hypothetical protein